MVQISEVHGICAPALPSVQDFMPLASTDGKAGARIKMPHHHGNLALSLICVKWCDQR